MARGLTIFEFDFILGDAVTLQCAASIRAGRVQSVSCHYGTKSFDTDGIIIDWHDEFIPMSESLIHYATEFYNESREVEHA